jgi:hypothetical protein
MAATVKMAGEDELYSWASLYERPLKTAQIAS